MGWTAALVRFVSPNFYLVSYKHSLWKPIYAPPTRRLLFLTLQKLPTAATRDQAFLLLSFLLFRSPLRTSSRSWAPTVKLFSNSTSTHQQFCFFKQRVKHAHALIINQLAPLYIYTAIHVRSILVAHFTPALYFVCTCVRTRMLPFFADRRRKHTARTQRATAQVQAHPTDVRTQCSCTNAHSASSARTQMRHCVHAHPHAQ